MMVKISNPFCKVFMILITVKVLVQISALYIIWRIKIDKGTFWQTSFNLIKKRQGIQIV